jgi:predicted aspartyl protease
MGKRPRWKTISTIGFAISAWFVASASAQQCQLKRIASLDITIDPNGGILIPVSLDDSRHMMLMDTGAPLGILPASVVQELGLKHQPMPPTMSFYGATGTGPSQFTIVPSLKIGPDEARYTDFLVMGSPDDPPAGFDGTIGLDILHNFDLDLDFASNKLNLFSPDHCEGKVVYWAPTYTDAPMSLRGDGHISITVSLDGHDVDGVLDTGTSNTILSLTAAKQVFGLDAASPGVETVNVGSGPGQQQFLRYRFKSLSISGITVNNPLIILLPDEIARQSQKDLDEQKMQGYQGRTNIHAPHLVLGTDILRHLHLYIAFKEQKIYATAADAH